MPPTVNARRRYDSTRRAEQAAATRGEVLAAARACITQLGYAGTTVAEIARRAGVAVDTVYASVGRKPQLMRALVESALSGRDEAIPAHQREYVAAIRAEPSATGKIARYAHAVAAIESRLSPIFLALRDAAVADSDCAALWQEISARRAANMRDFAADLRVTGEVRDDLSDEQVADIVWSMNGPEYWLLLVEGRGWSGEQFGDWLADAWTRLLLRSAVG